MKTRRIFLSWTVVMTGFLTVQSANAFYNPQTGRWLNRDPIEEKGGRNLCAFLLNAPIGNFDKDGRAPFEVPWHPWLDLPKSDPKACKYGSIKFSMDFYVNGDTKPLLFAPPGAKECVRRFAWPVDCVCHGMSDNAVDQCVRGCLHDKYERTGRFPGVPDHLLCVQDCTGGDPVETAAFLGRLSAVLLSCAKEADCYVGFAKGTPGVYQGDCKSKRFSCSFGCPYRILATLPPFPPIIPL